MDSFVYILASKKNGTLYIWVTNNIGRRIYEHKQSFNDWFTKKYKVKNLVYYEKYWSILDTIKREKQIKKWNRKWKITLIERNNPGWNDLYHDIF
jgi:putative endonuclease